MGKTKAGGELMSHLTEESLNRWIEKHFAKLSPARRAKLGEYLRHMKLKGFSLWTIKANLQAVLSLGDGKPYEELGEPDLASWLSPISHLKPESVRSYKRRIKAFLRFVHGLQSGQPSPPFLRVLKDRNQRDLPKHILSPEEVGKLIASCESLRNRALVHVLYESGCRAGEVLRLRVGDVEFDHLGGVVVVKGKTGMRRVRLIESVPDLQRWLTVHPQRTNPEAPLFLSKSGGFMTNERLDDMLKQAARKAGINKRVYAHLLRHSRATHLAKVLTEDQLRVYFGWSKTSHVPARYVHLSGRDVDDALARLYGMGNGQGGRVCPRCGFLNPSGGLYCSRCSAVLSEAEAFRVEEQRGREDELVARVVRKLIELAPDVLERALRESGVAEEMNTIISGHQSGAAGGI
jgi:integrase/recombinase XerD